MKDTWLSQSHVGTHLDGLGHFGHYDRYHSQRAAGIAAGCGGDVVIVGQGCDHSTSGNAPERKELDPANRVSIVLGSVAFSPDRYGYDALPFARLGRASTGPVGHPHPAQARHPNQCLRHLSAIRHQLAQYS